MTDSLVVQVEPTDDLDQVTHKLVEPIVSGRIEEYDIASLEDDKTLLIVEQDRYLLINKKHLKGLYLHWRTKFLGIKDRNDPANSMLQTASVVLLIIHPHFASAWSMRKCMISDQLAHSTGNESSRQVLARELDFNKLLLLKHFKCEQAYIHRRWLTRKLLGYLDQPESVFDLFQSEVDLVIVKLVPKIKSNYYCWTYLNWLLTILDVSGSNNRQIDTYMSLLDRFQKLAFLMPSDNCLFHARLNLIITICSKAQDATLFDRTIVPNELLFLDDLLVRYPFYLTFWNYRKYFLLLVKRHSNLDLLELDLDKMRTNLSESLAFQTDTVKPEFDHGVVDGDLFRFLYDRDKRLAKYISETYEGLAHERLEDIKAYALKYEQFLEKFVA